MVNIDWTTICLTTYPEIPSSSSSDCNPQSGLSRDFSRSGEDVRPNECQYNNIKDQLIKNIQQLTAYKENMLEITDEIHGTANRYVLSCVAVQTCKTVFRPAVAKNRLSISSTIFQQSFRSPAICTRLGIRVPKATPEVIIYITKRIKKTLNFRCHMPDTWSTANADRQSRTLALPSISKI